MYIIRPLERAKCRAQPAAGLVPWRFYPLSSQHMSRGVKIYQRRFAQARKYRRRDAMRGFVVAAVSVGGVSRSQRAAANFNCAASAASVSR
jgi:hypothetical protein